MKEKGLAPVFLDLRLEYPAGWICARYKIFCMMIIINCAVKVISFFLVPYLSPILFFLGSLSSAPPPPPPPVNAWVKPLVSTSQSSLTSIPLNMISAAPTVKAPGGKPDSDQHDSGVELNSDHHGSNPSSQRNSPSADSKVDTRMMQVHSFSVKVE